jgi:homoserine O-acetyltransferase
MKHIITSLLLLFITISTFAQTSPKVYKVNIGNLKLESGKMINNCIIGYTKFGKPNADSSNIIVLFSWFAGKSDAYNFAMTKDNWLDTTMFHYIIIDALGNGVSSSPSNTKGININDFPDITIRDMVKSEYILLTQKLKIQHVYAVGGLSMGAFQAFQWIISYPLFMDKAVMMSGTPEVNAFDLLFFNNVLSTLETGLQNKDIQIQSYKNAISVFTMNLFTPTYVQRIYKPEEFVKYRDDMINSYLGINIYDWRIQMRALCSQNIYRDNKNSLEETCKDIKAKTMIIVNNNDHIVNPLPSKAIAKQLYSELLELDGDCGHLASMCEVKKIADAIKKFLTK